LRLWDYLNHACHNLAGFRAVGGLRRVQRGGLITSPGHSHIAGCLHIWQHYYRSPASGRERRREWELACHQYSLAGPRYEGDMAFYLPHSHQPQPRAALEQLYLLAYPN